jgi:prepilin-type N-terminal cleavage/methylation domain-containing protein
MQCQHDRREGGRRSTIVRGVSPALPYRVGFTLIELLVVIAIIAILAAILFPVFSQAREKARQAQCMSNQRNISMAMAQYTNDYDERVTPFEMWGGFTGCKEVVYAGGDVFRLGPGQTEACDPFQRWMHRLQPYMRNVQIFSDPSGSTCTPTGTWFGNPSCKQSFAAAAGGQLLNCWCWPWHPMFRDIPLSYGYNQLIAAHAANAGNIAKIQRPANVLLFSDSAHKDAVPEQVVFGQWWDPIWIVPRIIWANVCAAACDAPWLLPETGAMRRVEKNTRHHLGSILSFVDGHTKFIQHTQIWARGIELAGLDQLHRFRLQQ